MSRGIPTNLFNPLRTALIECGPFGSNEEMRDVFAHDLLKPFRDGVRDGSSPGARVDAILSVLHDKRRADTRTNALVLLLGVLRDKTDEAAECHERLATLANQLAAALQEYTDVQNPVAAADRAVLQANRGLQEMIFIAEYLQLVDSMRAVARVWVPKIVNGQVGEKLPSGTAWLAAPGYALTCWHVIENRLERGDTPITDSDLEKQVKNTLLTFDHTLPTGGADYGIEGLECCDRTLDYALLRLKDRSDKPLQERGLLTLAPDDPLTVATRLYIIQHPKGLPLLASSGRYERPDTLPNRFLHTVPAEGGTSGAPVLNLTNWGVVGLHKGALSIPADGDYGVAILLKPILEDIKSKRPDLPL